MKLRLTALLCSVAVTAAFLGGCGKEVELSSAAVINYTSPEIGEEIVVISVKDYGDITIKLFEDELPEACENFKTLAESGYYDDLIFHRVIENFMIQGGDPKGDGTGGESCWGGKFDGGTCDGLIHVAGALAYANSGSTSTNGSQFYIVTGAVYTEDDLEYYEDYYSTHYSDEVKELYETVGGTPWLDGSYTVFGQVIDGLDVVYAISMVETNSSNKPKSSVYIESITVTTYNGEEIRWYPTDYDSLTSTVSE